MPVELVPLCTIHVGLAFPIVLGPTPTGTRTIVGVTSFDVAGERLNGKLLGASGADWFVLAPEGGYGTLDVRGAFETDDGVPVYMHYTGRMHLDASPPTSYAAPLFEVGDERYRWLARALTVAKGIVAPDFSALDYEVFEVR